MKRNTALIVAVLSLAPGCVKPPPTLKEIASTLPKEFKDIVFTEHLGVGTALFGQLFKGKNNGPLVVSRDRIEHTTRDSTNTIPVSKVSRVTQRVVNAKAPRAWVVVEYEQDGAKKMIGFQQRGLGHEYYGEERI